MTHTARRFAVLLLVLAALAGISASAAMAWSDIYVQNVVYAPGNGNRSGYNSNLKGNDVDFNDNYGGSPQMCSEFIDSNGVPLNSAVCHPTAFIDSRTTSYGAARCWSDTGNNYDLYVNECETNN